MSAKEPFEWGALIIVILCLSTMIRLEIRKGDERAAKEKAEATRKVFPKPY